MLLQQFEEPGSFEGADGFRDAFLRSVDEYNSYGVAAMNPRYQVQKELAVQLYGFKVAWDMVSVSVFWALVCG